MDLMVDDSVGLLVQKSVTIIRRDLIDKNCILCSQGHYREYNDTYLICSSCADIIPRWLTKGEILKHQLDRG